MTSLRRALQHARNVLWELIVLQGKGEVVMSEETAKQVDLAERIAAEALEEEE